MPFIKVIKQPASDGSLYRCPCCARATLSERGGGEICHDCFWQDEGQDDPFADEVWGGTNGKLSLAEARKNFQQCGAYDPRVGVERTGRAKTDLRRLLPPAPEPAPAGPPQPSWWARLSRRQRTTLLVEGLALLLVAVGAYLFCSGTLTGEMLKDHGYYLWARGKGHYQPGYLAAFARDSNFQRRFLGQAVDSLHPFFPGLYGGAPRYQPDSLHAANPGHKFTQYDKTSRLQVYWLDSGQWGLAYCALVVDGDVRDFYFVNR